MSAGLGDSLTASVGRVGSGPDGGYKRTESIPPGVWNKLYINFMSRVRLFGYSI